MNDLRAQLAPGWSGVNVAITVVLFLMAWPLGLLMIAYIVWGDRLGLNLARPETLSAFGGRIAHAWRAGSASWGNAAPLSSGTPTGAGSSGSRPPGAAGAGVSGSSTTPAGGTPAAENERALRAERETLERERREFEAERDAWRERHGDGARDGEGRTRETLDS